jgi:hypothetical protein
MIYILARYGIPSDGWEIRFATYGDELGGNVEQRDGYNCGPIACVTLWKLLKPDAEEVSEVDVSKCRSVVVQELTRLIAEYSHDLLVTNR